MMQCDSCMDSKVDTDVVDHWRTSSLSPLSDDTCWMLQSSCVCVNSILDMDVQVDWKWTASSSSTDDHYCSVSPSQSPAISPSQFNIQISCFSVFSSESLEFITCQCPWIPVTSDFQKSQLIHRPPWTTHMSKLITDSISQPTRKSIFPTWCADEHYHHCCIFNKLDVIHLSCSWYQVLYILCKQSRTRR